MSNNITDDLKPIIAYSRELAILWKHGFINYEHLFVAMLKQKCMASDYLASFNANIWSEKVKIIYPPESKEKGSVPLTISAELVLKNAFKIASSNDKTAINTIHLLLAILSYDNEVSEAFNKAGIVIEDITIPYFKMEIKQFPSLIQPVRDKIFSKYEIAFLSFGLKNKKIKELYKNAVDLFHYRQYEDSVKICEIALVLSPGLIDLRELLAYNKSQLKDLQGAISLLSNLIEEKPKHTSYWLTLSYLYDYAADYEKAAVIIDTLLLEEPENDIFLNNKGFNLLRQQRYAESISLCEKAINKNPDAAYPLNNLGFAKYKLGETKNALLLIDKSLEIHKGNPFAYRNKGIIFMNKGNKDEARKNFNLALKFGFTKSYGHEVERLLKGMG